MAEDYNFLYKVMMFGEYSVGKSSLVVRLTQDEFNTFYHPTIGTEFAIQKIHVDGKIVKLQIWDTAGLETHKTHTTGYFYKVDGIMLVYSVIDRASFECVRNVLKYCRDRTSASVVFMLIGNKCDKEEERSVSVKEAQEFAEDHKLLFVETSALNSTNVQAAFRNMAVEILRLEDDTL